MTDRFVKTLPRAEGRAGVLFAGGDRDRNRRFRAGIRARDGRRTASVDSVGRTLSGDGIGILASCFHLIATQEQDGRHGGRLAPKPKTDEWYSSASLI
jgi:hypothetical protein